jgi:hypothetical protein
LIKIPVFLAGSTAWARIFFYQPQSPKEEQLANWDCVDKTPTTNWSFDTGQMPTGQGGTGMFD